MPLISAALINDMSVQEGIADMQDAQREKATEEHGVIDDAIQDRGEGYTVFSIVSLPLHLVLSSA